jgi:hypothetical protein
MVQVTISSGVVGHQGQRRHRPRISADPLHETRLPLAPYLFILATDVLGPMLADPRYRVEGLSLSRGGFIRDQTFADDTALNLKGSPSNLDRAQRVLMTSCQAFGAKINWHKSAAIWASK